VTNQEWLDMAAVHAVEKPVQELMLYNKVIACREGKVDTVCWAGNAVNEGVTAKLFKMESLQSVARVMQQGGWMLSFDLKRRENFQIPLQPRFHGVYRHEGRGQVSQVKCSDVGPSSAPKI
jgi:hypothetical protein